MPNCRICQGEQFNIVLSNLEAEFGESFALKQCGQCSFITIDPLPAVTTLQRYYGQAYWQGHENRASTLLPLLFNLRMCSVVKEIESIVQKKGRILDWGAGDGSLLRLLRRKDFECWGIDSFSADHNDEYMLDKAIEDTDFPEDFFDAITCFHVLEHIEQPLDSLQKAFRLLRDRGTIVIEVPNIGSLGFHLFGRRWQPLEIPTHLNHFTLASLQWLFGSIANAKITKVSFFSHRISPSAIVLSLFPRLSPKRMRTLKGGRYPFTLMAVYLFLQILAYPPGAIGALLGRGEVIRMFVRKIS